MARSSGKVQQKERAMAARITGGFSRRAEAWEYIGADGKETREEGNKEIRERKLKREEIITGATGQGD